MKINTKETLISKFIETKELNILITNIYNSYFEGCRQSIDEFIISRHSDKNNAIYNAWLEVLEIDPDDFEFAQLSKQYHLSEIKELKVTDYKNNPYLSNVHFDKCDFGKRTIEKLTYNPYECFLYDSLEIQASSFYKEINKLGYFKEPLKYFEASNKDGDILAINPYEINVTAHELSSLKGDVLAVGLGLGYFTYLASLKDDINSVTTLENDVSLIEFFNENVAPIVKNTKITIANDNLSNYLKINNDKIDFVYITLSNDINKALKEYIEYKKLEKLYTKYIFIYHNEKLILALLRRYVIILFEENLQGFTEKDYLKGKNFEDKLMNSIYSLLKNKTYKTREDIDKELSDSSLKTLASKLEIK